VPDTNVRDAKLVQYLNEAYGKEKQLETALTAHIQMTTRPPYKKRLQAHLRETKAHAREVERRIKKLGGAAESATIPGPEAVGEAAQAVQNVANRAAALAQGPLHALRGTSEPEKMLKNAKTEYQDEAEEIATYSAIEALAEAVGDRETAQLAKRIRREEERMRDFLGKQIPTLVKAVATTEIPASERRTATRRRSSTRRRSASSSSRSRSTSSRSSGSRSSGSRSSGSRSTSSRSSGSRSGGSRSSGSRSTSSRSSSGSRSKGSRSTSGGRSSSSRSTRSSRSGSSSSGARSSRGSSSNGGSPTRSRTSSRS
jgi:ferritin-like metal-binding protein YciE